MLYHIRFFKVPTISIDAFKKGYELNAVITIANDLGDSYFFGDVDLKVDLGPGVDTTVLRWRSGARSCNLNLKLPNRVDRLMMTVIADISSVRDILEENPQFLPLKSSQFGVTEQSDKVAIRYDLLLPIDNGSEKQSTTGGKIGEIQRPQLLIAEEAGTHNLARHVWDAGLSTCQWLFDGSLSTQMSKKDLLGNPERILELGTGCGLVGLALSKMFVDSTIVLTDLEDAKEICERNLELNNDREEVKGGRGAKRKRDDHTSQKVLFKIFNWEDELAPSFKEGYGWDLVVVTDCTYNPSSYDSLLKALDKVTSRGTRILLAHKYRDSDEEEFFDRLKFEKELDTTIEYYSQSVRLLIMKVE